MMPTTLEQRRIRVLFLGVWFVLGSLVSSSSQDSTMIVSTVDLNCDCVQDTLVARSTRYGRATHLSAIIWGKRTDSTGCDSAWYSGRTTNWHVQTTFTYPDWIDGRTSVNIIHANQDTYKDLLFSYRGFEVRQRFRNRDSTVDTVHYSVDTTISILLFAQRGLDSLSVVDYAATSRMENDSLIVKRLDPDDDFTDKQRTTAGIKVAKLKLASTILNVPSEEMRAENGSVSELISMRVFPNPANDGLFVVEAVLGSGVFDLIVFDALGNLINKQTISDHAIADGGLPLMLQHVPSGIYTVVLKSQDGLRFTSQLVSIVH